MSDETEQTAASEHGPAGFPEVRLLPDPDPLVHRMSGAEIEAAAKFYHRKPRQIRRWVATGSQKGIPCPLFKPALMPAWWCQCMSHTVPTDILVLAIGVNGNCPPPGIGAIPPEPGGEPVDLKTISFDEADSVKQMRGLAQAVYQQLKEAYLKRSSDIPLLQRRYEQALNALRKEEAAEREAGKAAGNLIPFVEVERDMTAFAEMLRQMRESMQRRILELCPQLSQRDRVTVAEAIERVRAHEDRLLRRLDRFSSADEFLRELRGGCV